MKWYSGAIFHGWFRDFNFKEPGSWCGGWSPLDLYIQLLLLWKWYGSESELWWWWLPGDFRLQTRNKHIVMPPPVNSSKNSKDMTSFHGPYKSFKNNNADVVYV
jgi:hypothetical protein